MFIWNYLKGYVIIKAVGFYAQRFMNMAAYRGIRLWNVKNDDMVFTITFSYGDMEKVKKCALDSQCRIKTVKTVGLPAVFKRYHTRTSFLAGALFFVVFCCFMSNFVWTVKTEGNLKIPTEKLIEYVSNMGLKPGAVKTGLDLGKISNRLILDFDDAAWATIRLDGTKAIVSVSESAKSKKTEQGLTGDITASRDGVIESITSISGTSQVRAGDVVQKGQVLVKASVAINNDDGTFVEKPVEAEAFVRALTVYDITETVPLSTTENVKTGKSHTWLEVKIIGKKFDFGITPEFKSSGITETNLFRFKIGDWSFPLEFSAKKIYETKSILKTASKDELLQKSNSLLDEWTEENLDFDSYVIKCEKKDIFSDRGLVTNAVLTVSQRIDKK